LLFYQTVVTHVAPIITSAMRLLLLQNMDHKRLVSDRVYYGQDVPPLIACFG
jgi:hypothetical protein